MDAKDLRIAVVVSRWNELITKELLAGATDELERHGASDMKVVQVPGAWEVPAAAKALIDLSAGERPDAIVALGCILQGETPHARLLSIDVATGLMILQIQSGIPISWGILTPNTEEQALDRSGLKLGNKGREAALAAIEMANLIKSLHVQK
jgi:6,7-dimethyl-8-ribityllumazine synthase